MNRFCALWSSRGLLAAATPLCLASTLTAADRTWIGSTGRPPGDGTSFADSKNWTPSQVPGLADRARFEDVGGTIQFPAGLVINDRLLVSGEGLDLVFNLSGGVYRLNNASSAGATRSMLVGDSPGSSSSLTIDSGTVIAKHAALGAAAGAFGEAFVAADGSLQATSSLTVGDLGHGELTSLGELLAGDVLVASAPESVGALTLTGASAFLLAFGDLVGGAGASEFGVVDGALAAVLGDVEFGAIRASSTDVLVTGLGSSLLAEGDLRLGGIGEHGGLGTFVVDDDALVRGNALLVGPSVSLGLLGGRLDATSLSIVGSTATVYGGTLVINAADAEVGTGVHAGLGEATATIDLAEGATLHTSSLSLGSVVGSTSFATASGADTSLIVDGDAQLGWSEVEGGATLGVAQLSVLDGAALNVGGTLTLRQASRLAVEGGAAQVGWLDMSEDDGLLLVAFENGSPASPIQVDNFADLGGGMYVRQLDAEATPALGTVFPAISGSPIDGRISTVLAQPLPGLKYYKALPYGFSKGGDANGLPDDQVAFEITKLDVAVGLADLLPVDLPGVPNAIVAGDFNGDGLPDIFVTIPGEPGEPGLGALLVNTGAGNAEGAAGFDLVATIPLGVGPSGVAQGDLTGDGVPDFIVSNADDGTIQTIINTSGAPGAAVGGSLAPGLTLPVGGRPRGVMGADLRNVGALDLIWADAQSGQVRTAPNDGDGGFGTPTEFASGAVPTSVCPLDLDNDKDLDVAVVNSGAAFGPGFGGSSIGVHLSLVSQGGEGFAPAVLYPVGEGAGGITEGDLDGDGIVDLVSADGQSATISILVGRGDGTFRPAVALPTGGLPNAIAAGDLDNDSGKDLDLAVLVESDLGVPALTLFRNDSANGQLVLTILENAETLIGLPQALTTADTDQDGPDDLLLVGGGSGERKGEGFVSVVPSVPIICPADFDGDGLVDGADIGILLSEYGKDGPLVADLNLDGVVNEVDLVLLLEGYGSCKGGED